MDIESWSVGDVERLELSKDVQGKIRSGISQSLERELYDAIRDGYDFMYVIHKNRWVPFEGRNYGHYSYHLLTFPSNDDEPEFLKGVSERVVRYDLRELEGMIEGVGDITECMKCNECESVFDRAKHSKECPDCGAEISMSLNYKSPVEPEDE